MHTIHALYGFLGLPTDWDFLRSNGNIIAHNILSTAEPSPQCDMKVWAKQFNAKMTANRSNVPQILLGYSLGGRLAMHVLLDNPTLWQGAIIVSANPGLSTHEERLQRISSDEKWAGRFENDPWDDLLRDWNSNDVFAKKSPPFVRSEKDFSRTSLANIMRHWSLGKQDNLFPQIQKLNVPILWVAGENDTRYAALAKTMQLKHKLSKIWIAPNAAHRVPWEQSHLFQQQLCEYLTLITGGI